MDDKRKITILFPILFTVVRFGVCASGSGRYNPSHIRPADSSNFILLHPQNIEKPLKGGYA